MWALKISATGEVLSSYHLANQGSYTLGSAIDSDGNLYVLVDNYRTILKFNQNLSLTWQRTLVGPSSIDWQYAWSGYNNLAVSNGVLFQSGVFQGKSIVVTYPTDGNMIGSGDDWFWNDTIGQGTWETTTNLNATLPLTIVTPTLTPTTLSFTPGVVGTPNSTLYPVTTIGLHGGNGGQLIGVKNVVFEDGTVLSTAGVPDSVYRSPSNGINHVITTYNGGTQFDFTGDPVRWFDPTNPDNVKQHGNLTGYIIEYQAYDSNAYGVTIGTIHYSSFYGWQSNQEATHTENTVGDQAHINNNKYWITDGNSALRFESSQKTTTITIQWTAKLFWGEENNC